jgi:hypothetical protein
MEINTQQKHLQIKFIYLLTQPPVVDNLKDFLIFVYR